MGQPPSCEQGGGTDMSDDGSGDFIEGEEEEDEEEESDFDDEFPFMKGDHALYPRYQAAIQRQLQGRHDAIAAQLRDKKEEVKQTVKHREAIGVTLYSAQQQLA